MGRSAMNFRSSITWPLTCDTLDMLGLLYQLEQIRLYVNRDDGNWRTSRIGMMELWSLLGFSDTSVFRNGHPTTFEVVQRHQSSQMQKNQKSESVHIFLNFNLFIFTVPNQTCQPTKSHTPQLSTPQPPLNPSVALTFSSALPSTWKKHPKGFPAEDRLPTKPWVGWRDGDGFSTKTHRHFDEDLRTQEMIIV